MSIISAVRTYIKTYTGLKTNAPVWVGYLGPSAVEYNIVPIAGDKILEQYINGDSLRTFPFAFQSVESTADELARLDNFGFFEEFSAWLETQTEAGELPVLTGGKTAEQIEATGWGYLIQEGHSETGIYQVQCRVIYTQ